MRCRSRGLLKGVRIAGRLLTNVPKSIERGVKHLEPIIRERYAMMEKYGGNWHEKPVRDAS